MHEASLTNGINVTNDRGETGQARAASRHDANVLVGILAGFALAVGVIVEIGHSFAKLCSMLHDQLFDRYSLLI